MTSDYSSDAFKAYLDDAKNFEGEGHSLVHNLKGTASRLMANVPDGQFSDIRQADIYELIEAHLKTTGVSMTPHSKLTYKSRFNRAVSRFIEFQDGLSTVLGDDDLIGAADSLTPKKKPKPPSKNLLEVLEVQNQELQNTLSAGQAPSNTFDLPVLLRPETGLSIGIKGLPLDLTTQEAELIASFLKIYARKA